MVCSNTTVLAGAMIGTLLAASATSAAPTIGSCSPTMVKFIASDPTFFQTTSTTFVNLPQSAVNFTQGGTGPSCVIVSVSAVPDAVASSPPTPAPMTVRVMLDGTTAALPNEVDFSDGADTGNQVRSFDFIFPSVAPGAHNVRVQFKASPDAGFTDMNRHNVIVQFAP